jgi:hypothetical protein
MKACYDAEPFVAKGFRPREFFPHEVTALRKAYPDTLLQLTRRAVKPAKIAAGSLWQINLYSTKIEDFPAELFRDSTINWHQQQFGRAGLVAAAGLFIDQRNAYVSLLQSDLCQQIFRHPRLKQICASRINNRFRYWYKMLFNAVLEFALTHDLDQVFSPTAAQITGTTRKAIDGALFGEIYDSPSTRYHAQREKIGPSEYWKVPIAENSDRIVMLEDQVAATHQKPPRIICIYHDIEENVDTYVSVRECQAALTQMLEVERLHQVNATYNILGTIFLRAAPMVAASGNHSIAFHTYNHRLRQTDQLKRIREVDLQVKGYRTARSIITSELSDHSLGLYNFEWLMSSARSFDFDLPRVEHGIVKIPAHIDD